jgi:outer membrane protein TolC
MLFLRRRALTLFLLLATGTLPAAEPAKKGTIPKLRGAAPSLRAPMGSGAQFIGRDGQLETITLQDALGRAFEHNLDARFDKVDIKIEQARVRFAAGVFDPVFSASATRASTQRPSYTADITQADSLLQVDQLTAIDRNTLAVQAQTQAIQRATGQPVTEFPPITHGNLGRVVVFDQDSDRFEAGIQARTPLGTRFAISAREAKTRSTFDGDTRTIIPFYTAFGGIEVRQPLLKDFGPDANLADLRAGRIQTRVAELNWEKRVSDTAQQVMSVYFDLIFGLADLAVKQDAIAADEKLVTQNQRRLELGFMSPIDVQQARAAVSQDHESLLLSKNAYMERQFLLKRLILDEYKAGAPQIFVPVAVPDLPFPRIDRTAFLSTAFEKRLDYRAAITQAEVQNVRLKFAKNQLWPQLDVVGSYGYNGLAFDYSTAREKAYHTQAPEWTLGFQISVPFGNVQSRAQVAAIRGYQEQALIKIKQLEQTVTVDVDTVISRMETLKQRLETARQTTSLNEEAVRIAYRRLEEGQISSFDVIEQQRKLYDAKSRELSARAELNKTITLLWVATGTVLDETGVKIKK